MAKQILSALGMTLAIGIGVALSAPRAWAGAVPPAKHRVVFHVNVDQAERWGEVLTNVENVQKAFGPENVEIEVVAHGAGIGLLLAKNAELKQRIETIEKTGPVFAACSNTLKKKSIAVAELTPGVTVVDSGVAEVIRKQESGFTYVKLSY